MKVFVFLAGIALLSAGPATWLVPDLAANTYGISIESAGAIGYLRATAIRDVALGCWLLAMLFFRPNPRILAVSVFSIALVAFGDAINVLLHTGAKPASSVPHVGGFVVLVALGSALWRSEKPPSQ